MLFAVNDELIEVERATGIPLLDYLRQEAKLTGVKHACREGDCGSCVVMVGDPGSDETRYEIVTSCLVPLGSMEGRHVVTVEGLNGPDPGRIQRAFAECGASQCGFCTPGFIVAFTCHLLETGSWDLEPAIEGVAGNICRCTGYTSIVRAMGSVLDHLATTVGPEEPRIPALVREGVLPEYFGRIDALLADFDSAPDQTAPDPSQTIVAGGTDLYVQRPVELSASDVFIIRKNDADPIWRDENHTYLAGTATAEDMKRSKVLAQKIPGIDRAMALMGSLPIRNRATIAGNLVNASPIGDMTIMLLALDAEICLALGTEDRTVDLSNFFRGYKEIDLRPAEVVKWVRFSSPGAETHFNFEKVSKRTHLDIASVNTALWLVVADGLIAHAGISAGGVGPIPMQLEATHSFLLGREANRKTAVDASRIAQSEVSPISDVRGSAEYKKLLLGQLVLAHFKVLFGLEVGMPGELTA